MATVIDDMLLATVIVGRPPRLLRSRLQQPVVTTGLWYWRLCQAVLSPNRGRGRLSRIFATLDTDHAYRMLRDLPDGIWVDGFTELAPEAGLAMDRLGPMGLNVLATEAFIVAEERDAEILVATDNPRLRAAAEAYGVAYRQISM